MIFSSIDIKNFRGIASLKIENLARVNILLGPNNCGKTSILEAIFLLIGISKPALLMTIDTIRGLSHDSESDFRFPFYLMDYNKPIILHGDFLEKNTYRQLIITSRKSNSTRQISPKDIIDTNTKTASNEVITGINYKITIKKFQKQAAIFENYIQLKRLQTGLVSFDEGAIDKNYHEDLDGMIMASNNRIAPDLAKRLEKIVVEKKKEEITSILSKIDSKIKNFELGANNMIFIDTGLENMIPAQLMGDGLLKILNIAPNILVNQNGMLLIDEIDNGLHYSSLKICLKYIIEASKKYNCQIFCTSHNYELLKHLNEILSSNKSLQNDVKCFTISKTEDDIINAYGYDYDKLDFALDNEIEIRGNI